MRTYAMHSRGHPSQCSLTARVRILGIEFSYRGSRSVNSGSKGNEPQNLRFFFAGPAALFLSSSVRSSRLLLSARSAGVSRDSSSSAISLSFVLSSPSSSGVGDTGASVRFLPVPMAPIRLRGGGCDGDVAASASGSGALVLPPIWPSRFFLGVSVFGAGGGGDGAGASSGSEAVSEPASLAGGGGPISF